MEICVNINTANEARARTERLEGWVGALHPERRPRALDQRVRHVLKLSVHHHKTLDRLRSSEGGRGAPRMWKMCVCVCVRASAYASVLRVEGSSECVCVCAAVNACKLRTCSCRRVCERVHASARERRR
eukprot:6193516-Pleurochrysis_carterae.AAC.2